MGQQLTIQVPPGGSPGEWVEVQIMTREPVGVSPDLIVRTNQDGVLVRRFANPDEPEDVVVLRFLVIQSAPLPPASPVDPADPAPIPAPAPAPDNTTPTVEG